MFEVPAVTVKVVPAMAQVAPVDNKDPLDCCAMHPVRPDAGRMIVQDVVVMVHWPPRGSFWKAVPSEYSGVLSEESK